MVRSLNHIDIIASLESAWIGHFALEGYNYDKWYLHDIEYEYYVDMLDKDNYSDKEIDFILKEMGY